MQPANLGEQIHPRNAIENQIYYYLTNGAYKKVKVKEIATHNLNNQIPTGSPYGLLVVTYLPENEEKFIGFERYGVLDQPTKLFIVNQLGGRKRRRRTKRYRR
jgi:hypothetical protein